MDSARAYSDFEEKFVSLTRQVLLDSDYGIYDVKYISGSCTLKLFILKNQMVSIAINDCIAVDRMLSEEIELATWIPESFVLEVSSPGVYRDINSLEHFHLARGERITLGLFKEGSEELKIKGNKLVGILEEVKKEEVCVLEGKTLWQIPLGYIKNAKVDPRFEDLKNRIQ